MLKTFRILSDRFLSKGSNSVDRLEKNKVRNAIERVCLENLLDFNDVLTFEALPNALDSTLAVIEEPSLTKKYDFYQITATLFQARLKEISVI